jgi:hypothetical protein
MDIPKHANPTGTGDFKLLLTKKLFERGAIQAVGARKDYGA